MKKSSVLIPLSFLVAGFLSAYIIFDTNSSMDIVPGFSSDEPVSHSGSSDKIANPFLIKDTDESDVSRIDYLEVEVKKIKQQLEQINLTLQDLSRTA
ncbi:MAG TPA: hypothetical protein ENJ87_08075, partial [Gammaproteobacteria bacterium]|nr:hypothetical protein [Gammaproteobacteria bacterium]